MRTTLQRYRIREAEGPGPVVGTRGFTLIEAVIALVVVGVLGGATVTLLRSQNVFYGHLDDSVLAEQNLRAAADLAGSEIRMGAPEGLLAARADSVSLRFDVSQAVVCDVTGGNEVALMVYDSVANPALSGGIEGMAWSGPYQVDFEYADGWTGTSSSGAQATCTGNGAPGTFPAGHYRRVSGWSGVFSGVPPRGSIVRHYRQLTYRLAPSAMGNGYALWRGTQELIGPLDSTSSFAYVMADNSVQSNVGAGSLSQVRIVRMNLIAIDDDTRFDFQRSLSYDVPLRN